MSTENKTPREFWIAPKLIHPCDPVEPSYFYAYDEPGDPAQLEIHVREVLPETDGVWVSREDLNRMKRGINALGFSEYRNALFELVERIERGGKK